MNIHSHCKDASVWYKYVHHKTYMYVYTVYNMDTGDYASGPYQVEFPSGETEVTIMIPIMDDDMDECDENFFGYLRLPDEAASLGVKLGSADRATVTIKDDDSEPICTANIHVQV